MQKDMRYYIDLIESAQAEAELLNEGPVGKALATAALALGLNFAQQANAAEVFVYQDAQGELQTVSSFMKVPDSTPLSYVIDTDTQEVKYLKRPEPAKIKKPTPAEVTQIVTNPDIKQIDEPTEVSTDTGSSKGKQEPSKQQADKQADSGDISHIITDKGTMGIDDVPFSTYAVQSNNTVKMKFPYKDHKAILYVRDRDAREVFVSVSGQIKESPVKYKLDNYPTLSMTVGRSSGGSDFAFFDEWGWNKPWFAYPTGLDGWVNDFLSDEEKQMYKNAERQDKVNILDNGWKRIKSESKVMKLQLRLFNQGDNVYTFNVSQLFKQGIGPQPN